MKALPSDLVPSLLPLTLKGDRGHLTNKKVNIPISVASKFWPNLLELEEINSFSSKKKGVFWLGNWASTNALCVYVGTLVINWPPCQFTRVNWLLSVGVAWIGKRDNLYLHSSSRNSQSPFILVRERKYVSTFSFYLSPGGTKSPVPSAAIRVENNRHLVARALQHGGHVLSTTFPELLPIAVQHFDIVVVTAWVGLQLEVFNSNVSRIVEPDATSKS